MKIKEHTQEELEMLTNHAKNMRRVLYRQDYNLCHEGKRIYIREEMTRVVNYLCKYGINLMHLLA